MKNTDFTHVSSVLDDSFARRDFPSCICAIGTPEGCDYTRVIGYRRWFRDDAPCFEVRPATIPADALPANEDTLYDLASLSKLVSATMIALRLIEYGEITCFDSVTRFLDDVPEDKRDITIRHLLTHTSGITAHFHLDSVIDDPANAVSAILNRPLSRPIGSDVEYTCMGYILLGKILEKICGMPLDRIAEELVFRPLGMRRTCYNPLEKGENNIAATEYNQQMGKYICGVVHDENARFLQGISANAGVFSDLHDMTLFASMLSNHGETKDGVFLTRRTFDTAIACHTDGMSDERGWGFSLKGTGLSAMGDLYAVGSYGHNGFTGPSLYVDAETGLYTLLLANRVHFTRQSDGLFRFRRRIMNAAVGAYRC